MSLIPSTMLVMFLGGATCVMPPPPPESILTSQEPYTEYLDDALICVFPPGRLTSCSHEWIDYIHIYDKVPNLYRKPSTYGTSDSAFDVVTALGYVWDWSYTIGVVTIEVRESLGNREISNGVRVDKMGKVMLTRLHGQLTRKFRELLQGVQLGLSHLGISPAKKEPRSHRQHAS